VTTTRIDHTTTAGWPSSTVRRQPSTTTGDQNQQQNPSTDAVIFNPRTPTYPRYTGWGRSKLQTLDWAAIARRAEQNCADALARIEGLSPDVSLEAFIRAATAVEPYDHYKYFSDTAKGMVAHIKGTCGAPVARVFLRAALERTIGAWANDGRYQQLPPMCAHFHCKQLQRIANDSDVAAEWLDLDNDLFQKEFGIASMRLYVAGSNVVDYRCGISRSILFQSGPRKVLTNLRVLMGLGGFKPYFQGHLHAFLLDALNEEGRNDFYRCCAELYVLHPECLGMFCSSWFYDPALDLISPWLSYLRTIPLAGGAHLFHVQDGGEAIGNAIAKSRTRRKLYEERKYLPKTYMIVWGKRQQIDWARAHQRTE